MDQQQAQSQAQEQEGAPAPAPAPAAAPQNQNEPRTVEERQEARSQANKRWLNALANATTVMQISEEQVAHFENQLHVLQNWLAITRQGLANVNRHRTSREMALGGAEPSEDQLREFEREAEWMENNTRLSLDQQVQAEQAIIDRQQAWGEEHRTRIEEYRRWPQHRTAAEELNRYHVERGPPFHQSRVASLQHQIFQSQTELNFHQQSAVALQTRQPAPFPPINPRPQMGPQPAQAGPQQVQPPPQPFQQPPQPFQAAQQPFQARLQPNEAPHQQAQGLPQHGPQRRERTQAQPRRYPYKRGAAPLWTEEEENWLVVHVMYNEDTAWLSQNIPRNRRTIGAINHHLTGMRRRGRLPTNWTIRASNSTEHDWTIEEDMEIMRWHANGRTSIDVQEFFKYNRSGTAVFARANYLLKDPGLAPRVMEIENRQRERLLELDTNGDSGMPGADETADEKQGTEELRNAILVSLAARPSQTARVAAGRPPTG